MLGDFFQGFEDADALEGDGFDDGFILAAQFGGEQIDGQDVGQVALVQLEHVRNLVEVVAVFFQVRHQVVERFDVGVHALLLGVGDEDDAVDAAQNQLAAGVVEDLSGDGVEVDARLEAAYRLPRSSGRKSKNNVRSVSVASEIILPFCWSAVFW